MVSAQERQPSHVPEIAPVSEEFQLLLWRRYIYAQKLYAIPTGENLVISLIFFNTKRRKSWSWVMPEKTK